MMNYLNTYRRYACDIGRINSEAEHDPRSFIEMTERVFTLDLEYIVEQILASKGNRRVILLSGPSSSGKTTASKKLIDLFRNHGIEASLISMDDFYLGIDHVRILEDGKPDFESIEALDIPLIKNTIEKLSTTGECVIPRYDFTKSRRSDKTREIRLSSNSVIIMEGIHALNPVFSDGMSKEKVMKIYISVKQGIKDNEDYVLTNREIRFIRRFVRDYQFRHIDPQIMLSMWDNVVKGEVKYIRPYRYTSDFTINSIHIYEPCIMKEIALGLLDMIPESNENFQFIQHLSGSLKRFSAIDPGLIPEDSLLREFIGNGCYTY